MLAVVLLHWTADVCKAAQTLDPRAAKAQASHPEELLNMAWQEAEQNKQHIGTQTLVECASLLGRFDKTRASAILSELLARIPTNRPSAADLDLVEIVALRASHVNPEISTTALRILRSAGQRLRPFSLEPSNRMERLTLERDDPHSKLVQMRLKLLAIEFVLKRRDGAPDVASVRQELIRLGQSLFCLSSCCSPGIAGEDVVEAYLWRLDYGSAEAIRTNSAPPPYGVLEGVLSDLVHYRSDNLGKFVRRRIEDGKDKVALACALYEAGSEDRALALLQRAPPAHTGGGSPFGDLVYRVAARNPGRALVLAQLIKGSDERQLAYCTVVAGACRSHPEAAVRIAKQIENPYRKSAMLAHAVAALLGQGKTNTAREVAATIVQKASDDYHAVAQASIAASMKDADMMKAALQGALNNDRYGRGPRNCMRISLQSIGLKTTQDMLLALVPDLRTGWTDTRLFCMLDEIALLDPAWVLPLFQRGPKIDIERKYDVWYAAVLSLLPSLALADHAYVARYLGEQSSNVNDVAQLQRNCVFQVARRSEEDAVTLARDTGLNADGWIDRIRFENLVARLVASPGQGEDILSGAEVKHTQVPLSAAVEQILFRMSYGLADTNALFSLAFGLKDVGMGDVCLSEAAMVERAHLRQAMACTLLRRIRSPTCLVATLCRMARSGLAYAPSEYTPPLSGGWDLLEPMSEIDPKEKLDEGRTTGGTIRR